MHVNTDVLRTCASQLDSTRDGISHARSFAADVGDDQLGDLSSAMAAASKQMCGILDTVLAVQNEFVTGINTCADVFVRTDHKSAGTFRELA